MAKAAISSVNSAVEYGKAIDAYQAKFGDLPTLFGIPEDRYLDAAKVLQDAVQQGNALSDEQFDEAMGFDDEGEDAVI